MDTYTSLASHDLSVGLPPWCDDAGASAPHPNHVSSAGALTRERERKLLAAYAEVRDPGALAEIVQAHQGLVRNVVRRHRLRALRDEDLVAEGTLGLIEAARRFDPTYDVRFATYAAHWVRAKVQEHVIQFRRIVGPPDTRASRRILGRGRRVEADLLVALGRAPMREELAAALGVEANELDDVRASYDARDVFIDGDGSMALGTTSLLPSSEDLVAEEEERRLRSSALTRAMGKLPPRERDIIERRQLSCEPPPLHEIAREMSLSRERVRQLELRALRVLSEEMCGTRSPSPPRRDRSRPARVAAAAA